jgi:hypothetical protein
VNLWIDCEWNDFRGDLISMALVAEDGFEFYEVLHCERPSAWVRQNVIPVLGKECVSLATFQIALQAFLARFDRVHVIADWPEDVERFCRALIIGPGARMNTPPLTMEVRPIESQSAVPHNALEDARANRAACK